MREWLQVSLILKATYYLQIEWIVSYSANEL